MLEFMKLSSCIACCILRCQLGIFVRSFAFLDVGEKQGCFHMMISFRCHRMSYLKLSCMFCLTAICCMLS